MAHNDYARPANQVVAISVPTQLDFEYIDELCVECLDVVGGGSYYPKTPICLGGAGGQFSDTGARIEGGVETRKGGRLVLGDNDFPTLSPSRSRTTALFFTRSTYKFGGFTPSLGGLVAQIPANASPLWIAVPPRLLHQGATLATVTLTFRIGRRHSAIPGGVLPSIVFAKIDSSAAATVLGSASMPAPADADAYYNNGQPQTLAVAIGATIDTTAHSYVLEIQDETGTGSQAGNVFVSATFAHTGIADMRWT